MKVTGNALRLQAKVREQKGLNVAYVNSVGCSDFRIRDIYQPLSCVAIVINYMEDIIRVV